jgi:hypothetical protein
MRVITITISATFKQNKKTCAETFGCPGRNEERRAL